MHNRASFNIDNFEFTSFSVKIDCKSVSCLETRSAVNKIGL